MVNASTQKSLSSNSATLSWAYAKFIPPGCARGQAMAASTAGANANVQTIPYGEWALHFNMPVCQKHDSRPGFTTTALNIKPYFQNKVAGGPHPHPRILMLVYFSATAWKCCKCEIINVCFWDTIQGGHGCRLQICFCKIQRYRHVIVHYHRREASGC